MTLTLSRWRNTMAIYRSIRRFAQIFSVTIATMYFKWAIACSYGYHLGNVCRITARGGVEDTRLEAKAKDTKKSEAKDSLSEGRPSRGQGQECSRPRPRTKDTAARVLQKKKRKSSKKFFRQSLIYRRSQNF